VTLGIANTRMKDFYDLWVISRTFDFAGDTLSEAVRQTFARRRTELPNGEPTGFSDAFVSQKEGQWRAFRARERLSQAAAAFDEAVARLRVFLLPPLSGFDEPHRWSAGGPWVNAVAQPKLCHDLLDVPGQGST
jgi:hypothetical protein